MISEGDVGLFIRDFYEPTKKELKKLIEENGPGKSENLIDDSIQIALEEWREMEEEA